MYLHVSRSPHACRCRVCLDLVTFWLLKNVMQKDESIYVYIYMYNNMQIYMYAAMCLSVLSVAGAFGPCCAHARGMPSRVSLGSAALTHASETGETEH